MCYVVSEERVCPERQTALGRATHAVGPIELVSCILMSDEGDQGKVKIIFPIPLRVAIELLLFPLLYSLPHFSLTASVIQKKKRFTFFFFCLPTGNHRERPRLFSSFTPLHTHTHTLIVIDWTGPYLPIV